MNQPGEQENDHEHGSRCDEEGRGEASGGARPRRPGRAQQQQRGPGVAPGQRLRQRDRTRARAGGARGHPPPAAVDLDRARREKKLITKSKADTVYSLKGTLPPGFSLSHILSSRDDCANFGLVNIKIQAYDLQTAGGSTASDCLPGPLDILSVEQWIRRSIAPFVQGDGRLKQAVDVAITIYAWKDDQPFRGIWFVGVESGKRCALREQFIETDPKAPASPLRAIKEVGGSGRKLVVGLAKKHGSRLVSMAAQRLGGG
ncbi:MAG: hypothetical protein IPG81_28890 [Sandaracinaceae bacterium]|nr:hypothetical protein [Sandaracinaceae bacterium]